MRKRDMQMMREKQLGKSLVSRGMKGVMALTLLSLGVGGTSMGASLPARPDTEYFNQSYTNMGDAYFSGRPDSLPTTAQVQDSVNQSGWWLHTGGDAVNSSYELVKPGQIVRINGGDSVLVRQNTRKETFNIDGQDIPYTVQEITLDTTPSVRKLDQKIDKVGAGAAALAALHPQDFDPDNKWSMAFGYGNYGSANAGAVAAYYRPNEDVTFSMGGTYGNGENMLNAGLSFKLGKGITNASKVSMAKEIIELRAQNNDLQDQIDELRTALNGILGIVDPNKKAYFPDVPENHWAYEYIATLAGNGIIEGYPDGVYKGDSPTTRYEMAAMVYRALEAGAPVDTNMRRALKEFSPEIAEIQQSRVRVDRISGGDLDRNKVERVHINNSKLDGLDIYGSVIR